MNLTDATFFFQKSDIWNAAVLGRSKGREDGVPVELGCPSGVSRLRAWE